MDVGDVEKNSQFSNWENYFAFIYLYCTCCKIVCNVCPFIERKIGSMERKVERLKYHRGYRATRLFQVNFTPRSHPWCIHIRHPCICAQYRPAVYVPMRIDRGDRARRKSATRCYSLRWQWLSAHSATNKISPTDKSIIFLRNSKLRDRERIRAARRRADDWMLFDFERLLLSCKYSVLKSIRSERDIFLCIRPYSITISINLDILLIIYIY